MQTFLLVKLLLCKCKVGKLPLLFLSRPPLNPQLEDLLLRLLTKDPNERITVKGIKVCVISTQNETNVHSTIFFSSFPLDRQTTLRTTEVW